MLGCCRASENAASRPNDHAAFAAAVAAVRRRARGALAPVRAAEAVAIALTASLEAGLAREQAIAADLHHGPQSQALRHLFYAERRAARMPDAAPWPVRRVGVIGGGTMGSGIAVAFADAGLDVTLVEVGGPEAQAAERRVRAIYDRQLQGGRLNARLHEERTGRIRYAMELARLRDADFVVEGVAEDLAVKQTVFRAVSGLVRRDTVLASNTSYLDIDRMADGVDAPERVIGLHFCACGLTQQSRKPRR
jgi:3-hydroxyacyl-CoA dehydrogenase